MSADGFTYDPGRLMTQLLDMVNGTGKNCPRVANNREIADGGLGAMSELHLTRRPLELFSAGFPLVYFVHHCTSKSQLVI